MAAIPFVFAVSAVCWFIAIDVVVWAFRKDASQNKGYKTISPGNNEKREEDNYPKKKASVIDGRIATPQPRVRRSLHARDMNESARDEELRAFREEARRKLEDSLSQAGYPVPTGGLKSYNATSTKCYCPTCRWGRRTIASGNARNRGAVYGWYKANCTGMNYYTKPSKTYGRRATRRRSGYTGGRGTYPPLPLQTQWRLPTKRR